LPEFAAEDCVDLRHGQGRRAGCASCTKIACAVVRCGVLKPPRATRISSGSGWPRTALVDDLLAPATVRGPSGARSVSPARQRLVAIQRALVRPAARRGATPGLKPGEGCHPFFHERFHARRCRRSRFGPPDLRGRMVGGNRRIDRREVTGEFGAPSPRGVRGVQGEEVFVGPPTNLLALAAEHEGEKTLSSFCGSGAPGRWFTAR